jgi:hypothetical protein
MERKPIPGMLACLLSYLIGIGSCHWVCRPDACRLIVEPATARRPASVIRTRATLIDLPQLFPEDCGFLF